MNANYYKIIDKVLDVDLVNSFGKFKMGSYKLEDNNKNIIEVMLLYKGDLESIQNVRINSACLTGDIFGCTRCDCNEQLINAQKTINELGNGLIIYLLHHEGRGIGVVNKLKTMKIMDEKQMSSGNAFLKLGFEKDKREYASAVTILKDLNINELNLITNNPSKIKFLRESGIKVKKRIPTISKNKNFKGYLKTKKEDFGHLIDDESEGVF